LKVKASDLYSAYKTWCQENGEQTLNSTNFGKKLNEKGYQGKKQGSYVYRHGIKIDQGSNEQDS